MTRPPRSDGRAAPDRRAPEAPDRGAAERGRAGLPAGPLQWSHAREVAVELEDGRPVVVKRFRHPGRLARLRDRVRARRELRWLAALAERGVAVPRPLGLRRGGGGWGVAMEWIEGAVDLRALVAGAARWPAPPERLARRLGKLLAALHANGVDHPDLHPGNVLVDRRGRVWAVDFHHARRARGGRARPRTVERDLVALESALRERAPARFRLRALVAWHAALPEDLSRALPPLRALAEAAARRAVPHRRREAARQARRWLRESELCTARAKPVPTFLRRGAPGNAPARIEARLAERGAARAPSAARAERVLLADFPELGRTLDVWRGGGKALRAIWLAAARVEEHAVPAARPFCLRLGPAPWLALEAPLGTRGGGLPPPATATSLERELAQRGLAPAGPLRVLRAPGGWILGATDGLQPAGSPGRPGAPR